MNRILPQRHRVTEVMENHNVKDLNKITEKIIGCAIEVHRTLGPGLLESIYESALCYEFDENNVVYARQFSVPIIYKGHVLGEYRLDVLVENEVIVELKAVDRIEPVFEAQLLSYLRVTGKKLGLLINFNVPVLKKGIKRVIL
jgi:GxxExxY protein